MLPEQMKYNPKKHRRKSIRLKGYDYSQAGLYFITICVRNRKCLFGEIVGTSLADAEMELNDFGIIAHEQWEKLSERFTNFELDVFQIMPNHMHGIILLNQPVGAGFTPAQNDNNTTDNKEAGQAQPLPIKPLVISLVHINHWWQMNVWNCTYNIGHG